jgi:ABC-type Fe3+/spermidine/putrescine transport system ATPase subunit
MIRLLDVSSTFGAFSLKRINLQVRQGDYWVVVGPSGAGKSALLQVIAGFKRDYSGQVMVHDRELKDLLPEKRNLGYVFQQDALFPHLTVAENLRFPLKLRKLPAAEAHRRIEEYATRMKITGLLARTTESLSGGEIQRVAIARSLIYRPEVLLLDDPLSALDHNSRIQLQEELKQLRQELGFTALHVTHSRDEAFALASHVAVIHAGELIQADDCATIRRAPATAFVREFLGL